MYPFEAYVSDCPHLFKFGYIEFGLVKFLKSCFAKLKLHLYMIVFVIQSLFCDIYLFDA